VKGTPRTISIRHISALQLKRNARKGCQLHAIHVLESSKKKESKSEDYPIIQEFKDAFPKEIPGLHPKRYIDFSIDLMLVFSPISRAPYRMSTPKLVEPKMQLQDLLDKGYTRPSMSH
jgi:hypothetical protein